MSLKVTFVLRQSPNNQQLWDFLDWGCIQTAEKVSSEHAYTRCLCRAYWQKYFKSVFRCTHTTSHPSPLLILDKQNFILVWVRKLKLSDLLQKQQNSLEYDNLHIQIKTQLLKELCGVQCEKGEKYVGASVGSAQTLCKDVGGNRNLTDNKIFQRANLPKANCYSHKHLTLRRCAELRQQNVFRASWRHSGAMGTAQRGACPATGSALGF